MTRWLANCENAEDSKDSKDPLPDDAIDAPATRPREHLSLCLSTLFEYAAPRRKLFAYVFANLFIV